MEEQKKYDLFDRYLRGELDQKELDSFMKELGSDEALKEEFDMYQYLVEGIREHEKQELKAYMTKKAGVRYIGSPWSKNFTYASAAILIGFGVLYVVLDNRAKDTDLAINKPIEIPKSPETQVAPDGEVKTEENKEEYVVPEIQAAPVEVDTNTRYSEDGQKPDGEKTYGVGDMPVMGDRNRMAGSNKGEDDFPVRTDTRIMDTLITLAIRFEKVTEQSIDTGESPEAERTIPVLSEKILVQFWKSPINYKGYRFDGRKLVLFGLDSISQVDLKYRVLDAELKVYDIYLVYGKLHVKLIDDNRYNAYIRETNPAILNELK